MTEQGMTLIQFANDFAEFEQNRMYPPGYRKESAMSLTTNSCRQSEVSSKRIIQNFMCPVGCRKEPTMKKPNLEHVASISRAVGYVKPHIVPNMSPNHRQLVEDDLDRLKEVKEILLYIIYHQGNLLFGDKS